MIHLLRGVIAATLVFAAAVSAQADTIVIRASGYLDMDRGRIVTPAVIVVEDDRITAINVRDVPEDAEDIDLSGLILLPGLIDVHTHLTFDIERDWAYVPVLNTPADLALRGARNARQTLMAGFTTVRDVGSIGFADISLMHAIDRDFVVGPRMFAAGNALGITGGHCDVTGFAPGVRETGPEDGVADGVAEVLKAVRYTIKHGANVIKFCATAGVLSNEGPVGAQQFTLEEMRAIVEEARRHGLKVAAHAHGTEGIIAAARAGVDSIEHDSLMTEEAADIISDNDIFVVPNLYLAEGIDLDALPANMRAKAEAIIPSMFDSFRLALDEDIRIAFGTDAAVFPHGQNAREFAARVEAGQRPIDAIRSATTIAAELLGVEDRGRISEGLLADIVGVRGNPLEDITRLEQVEFVMKGGKIYKLPEE